MYDGSVSEWTPDTLHEHIDRILSERAEASAFHHSANEHRHSAHEQSREDMQTRWSSRFTDFEKLFEARLAGLSRRLEELQRLVYIGLGIVLVVSLALGVGASLLRR